MNPEDQENAIKSFDKAKDSLDNAKYNLDGEFYSAVANRAYYCCYYSITALLYTKAVYAKTHRGAQAKFSQLFIKTRLLPVYLSDAITLLFNFRQEADYDLEAEINQEDAALLIKKAEVIMNQCLEYFHRDK